MSGQVHRDTFVYGAGRMGREVLAHCRAQGIEPTAFIDRAAKPGAVVDGVRVITPEVAACEGEGDDVLVALHSPGVDVASVIDALRGESYADVRTLWTECARSGWRPQSPFWLDPTFDVARDAESIARVRALMSDERSRHVFGQQIALRTSGDYAALDAPTPADQYMPSDLAPWSDPMRLLDCGAYDGDTIRALRSRGHTIDGFIALEPDDENFARLSERHGHDVGGRLLKVGAYSETTQLHFKAGEGGAAHVDPDGETTIDVTRIDDLCIDFRPTLIKMDIEGAEQAAIEGAIKTLRRDRPDLAISVYHRVDDLWRIPLQVEALDLGYRFYMRSHAHNGFDTVLCAVALPA